MNEQFNLTYKLTKKIAEKKKLILIDQKFFFIESENHEQKSHVHIRITPNNTLITITKAGGEVFKSFTVGKLKLHSSKKNYKYVHGLVISEFVKFCKKSGLIANLIIHLHVPKILLKRVLRRLKSFINNDTNLISIDYSVPFNGCRAKKGKRKKRKGLRLFKPSI